MSMFFRVLLVGVAAGLAACGGGSDKSSGNPASSSAAQSSLSSLPHSSSATSLATISSAQTSVVASISASALSSEAQSSSPDAALVRINGTVIAFDTSGAEVILDPDLVDIQVHLLDSEDRPLKSEVPEAVRYGTAGSLRFTSGMSVPGPQSVAVTVSYPAFTSYSRKLEAKDLIDFNAKLQAVPAQTVEITETQSISGASVDGFNITVNGSSDDQQSDSMLIQIPRSLLPEGTESLDVAVRTFDPNDKNDSEFFPGAYADSSGNALVSVAFNFAKVNTDIGESLPQAMLKARQQKVAKASGAQKVAADEPVIINREIPEQSCRLLEQLGDSDKLSPGFQVPVYTYNPNSGVWDLLGHGTVYSDQGEMVSETQQKFNCETASFSLEILVTHEIFLSEWWNLDYPLTFTQPTNYCARVALRNTEGQSLAGVSGLIVDDNGDQDFARTFFTSDEQGIANIRVSQSGSESQATLSFYHAGEIGYVEKTIQLSPNCESTETQIVELTLPSMCSVSGTVRYENGTPLVRELIYALSKKGSSTFGFDYVNSDAQGNYRLNLPCGGSYQLTSISAQWKNENLEPWLYTDTDGSLQTAEQSDDGRSVVMKPIQANYIQPFVYSYYVDDTNELVLYVLGHYSAFPMTYSATITNQDGSGNYNVLTGSIAPTAISDDDFVGYFNIGVVRLKYDLPDQAAGYIYPMTLNITDALNKNWPNVASGLTVVPTDELPNELTDEETTP